MKKLFFNPFTDFGFKKLFGEEASKELLTDFLNQLLPEKYQISDLFFVNPEVYPDTVEERKAIYDIHCKSIEGERFIVEMQKAPIENFKERALYYITFPIRDQAHKGEWDYNLQPVFFIGIVDFNFETNEGLDEKVKIDVNLKDESGNIFYDKLHFSFLQMPLFKKNEWELETRFDKWLFFLKNLENFDQIPGVLNEAVFRKGFEIASLSNLSSKELKVYQKSVKKYLDMKNVLDYAKKVARAEGLKEGREEGRVEGREIGREEGERAALKKFVKKALERGLTVDEIVAITGISAEEIKKLQKK